MAAPDLMDLLPILLGWNPMIANPLKAGKCGEGVFGQRRWKCGGLLWKCKRSTGLFGRSSLERLL
jgi:hypothetical protein